MMKINGFNGTNTQTGAMGMAQANDSVSKKYSESDCKCTAEIAGLIIK